MLAVVLALAVVMASGAAVGARPSGASYADSPPLGHTGGFGEKNCQACHWENPLNNRGALVEIVGVPHTYQPGVKYELIVRLRHADMKIAGFQLAARFAQGADSAKQAGEFRTVDDRAKVTKSDSSAIFYVGHTRVGTKLTGVKETSWKFEWTAPATASGAVRFNVAANAADDTNSEGGDYIYVATILSERVGMPTAEPPPAQ